MKKAGRNISFLLVYILVLCAVFLIAIGSSKAATVLSENASITGRKCIVIDAGHGGEDGGAISCSGALESQINLEISLKLNDLMHLLGIDTVMVRDTDISVYTQGETIAQKKVSDLKERVRIVNETENGLLVSIHQNTFSDSQYYGAQVFYGASNSSKELAERLQTAFVSTINAGSNRQAKKSTGVYLMEHIDCTGILVECGFLSNPAEEAKLRDSRYQKKLCCVIASVCSIYLHTLGSAA